MTVRGREPCVWRVAAHAARDASASLLGPARGAGMDGYVMRVWAPAGGGRACVYTSSARWRWRGGLMSNNVLVRHAALAGTVAVSVSL